VIDAADARLVAEMVGIILFAAGGGGAVHAYNRRKTSKANGSAAPEQLAQSEILRQHLHDQRHGETIRILGDVASITANAAKASERAAEAAERAAGSTERLSVAVERHLERCN